jgi:hypothetical protein
MASHPAVSASKSNCALADVVQVDGAALAGTVGNSVVAVDPMSERQPPNTRIRTQAPPATHVFLSLFDAPTRTMLPRRYRRR